MKKKKTAVYQPDSEIKKNKKQQFITQVQKKGSRHYDSTIDASFARSLAWLDSFCLQANSLQISHTDTDATPMPLAPSAQNARHSSWLDTLSREAKHHHHHHLHEQQEK